MNYIITKTIDDRFVYYYGLNGWEGLKDNAFQMTKEKASSKCIIMENNSPHISNQTFDYIEYKTKK